MFAKHQYKLAFAVASVAAFVASVGMAEEQAATPIAAVVVNPAAQVVAKADAPFSINAEKAAPPSILRASAPSRTRPVIRARDIRFREAFVRGRCAHIGCAGVHTLGVSY
jgi:hypothetical protein